MKVWAQVQLKTDGRAGVVTATDKEKPDTVVVAFDDGKTEEVKVEDLKYLGD